jgi:hypothetical protein
MAVAVLNGLTGEEVPATLGFINKRVLSEKQLARVAPRTNWSLRVTLPGPQSPLIFGGPSTLLLTIRQASAPTAPRCYAPAGRKHYSTRHNSL